MKCLLFLIFWIQCISLITRTSSRAPMAPIDPSVRNTQEIMRYAKAASIKNYMNESIDPCKDFYEYACGNWAHINPAVKTTKNGIFNVLTEAYNRRVLKWMEEPRISSESEAERKVKNFYESCVELNETNYKNRENLLSIMEEFGGMPALKGDKWKSDEFDWLTVVAEILRKYGKQIIIGMDVSSDIVNNQVNRFFIGQPKNVVSTRAQMYYSSLKLQYSFDLRNVFGMNDTLAYETATEISNFEEALANGISDPLDGVLFHDKCRKRSLEDMTMSYMPTLNYTRFVYSWLGYNYQLPVYEYVESYQQNLKALIEKTKESTIANYIMLHLIQDFRMEPEETKEKQKLKCIDKTKKFFVKYLDNVVYRQLLEGNKNLNEDIQVLWEDLKANFEETLLGKDSLWMTPETRDKALVKLSAMTLEINSYEKEDFEKEYTEIVIDSNTFFENLVSIMENRGQKYREKLFAEAKIDSEELLNLTPGYAADFNRILIPASFLHPRFLWDPVYPVAIKYGTAGYVIAHEMAHGFDDNARHYDPQGNLNNWWDQKSTDQYLTRKECLSQHYSEYRFAGESLARSNAQDENLADVVGIRIAFNAYKRWLSKQTNSTVLGKETLPYLNLTPSQLFFVGTAQIWCVDIHRLVRSYLTKIDVHVPEEIRVAAMISNFEAFADEFHCQADAKMNPQRKCVIF